MANRVLIQARGDVFSLPGRKWLCKRPDKELPVLRSAILHGHLTENILPYWSDQSGEYELWLMEADKENAAKKLTDYGAGYRYHPFWSPDSKKIAFIDKAMQIKIFDVTTNKTTDVDRALRYTEDELERFTVSWSPDSRWMAYNRDMENQHNAIYIYDYTDKKNNTVTRGFL
jgi:tricorn protease